MAGAASASEVESMLRSAGFVDIGIEIEAERAEIVEGWDAETDLREHVASAQITATKPAD